MQFFNNDKKILGYKWSQLLAILAISLFIIIAGNFTFFSSAEYKFSSLFSKTASNDSELVVIEYAADDINRASFAGIVQLLVEAKSKSILLDIDLSQPDTQPLDDDILSNTLKANQTANIILSLYSTEDKIIRPLSSFRKYAKVGFVDRNLDDSAQNQAIALNFDSASKTYPHAVLLQLGKHSSNQNSTYIDPAISQIQIDSYAFSELSNSDTSEFKNKHIIIGPNSVRTKIHALLLESLKRGEVNSVSGHFVFATFLFLSLLLINLFAKNENRLKIIIYSVVIAITPLVLNYISITLFRTLFPSLLLFIGLTSIITLLSFFNRNKFSLSLKSFNLERNSNKTHLNELLEGEISVGKNGVVLKADSIAAKLLGFKDQNLVGTPLRKIAPSIKQEKWRAFYSELINLNKPNEHLYELDAKHTNGEVIKLQLQLKKDTYVNSISAQFILRNTMGKSGELVALEYQAKQDKVSRTLNKDGIYEYLDKLLANADKNSIITTLVLRIVNLPEITSTLGDDSSEKIIKSFATNLFKNTDDSATIGRTQNSEFLVVFNHHNNTNIDSQISKVSKIAKNTIHTSGISIELDLHAGIARYPEHGKQADELLKAARLALVAAIDNNKKIETYKTEKKSKTKTKRKSSSLLEIHTALKENQFKLFYQPIISLTDNGVTSAEALLRWKHPKRGLIRPNEFIDQIEHSKLVRPMTKWVINTALNDARQLGRYGLNVSISVNISERNLLDSHFPVLVAESINKNKMRADNIEFEISEKKLHQIPEQAIKLLTRFKANGINFSLDNYGSENMSLLNLRKLPFSKIKIHRPLVARVIKSHQDEVVIDAIIRLAHGFGISVVAEGVESELHYNKLKQLGCNYCQGHLFSKPVSVNRLIKLFENWDNTMDDSQEIPAQAMATWNGQYNNN